MLTSEYQESILKSDGLLGKEGVMSAGQIRSSRDLLTYEEAAQMLGIQIVSVKQLVVRGHLHSIAAPEDRRRRRLIRSEVEAYRRSHAGKWNYPWEPWNHEKASVDWSPIPELPSPNLVAAGVVSAGAAIPLITAFKNEKDIAIRLLILGALIGLAYLLFQQWQQQGKLDDAQKRRMDKLAKTAEAAPDEFVAELEQLITKVA
jgi:excisionase family DNA binding protein